MRNIWSLYINISIKTPDKIQSESLGEEYGDCTNYTRESVCNYRKEHRRKDDGLLSRCSRMFLFVSIFLQLKPQIVHMVKLFFFEMDFIKGILSMAVQHFHASLYVFFAYQ